MKMVGDESVYSFKELSQKVGDMEEVMARDQNEKTKLREWLHEAE